MAPWARSLTGPQGGVLDTILKTWELASFSFPSRSIPYLLHPVLCPARLAPLGCIDSSVFVRLFFRFGQWGALLGYQRQEGDWGWDTYSPSSLPIRLPQAGSVPCLKGIAPVRWQSPPGFTWWLLPLSFRLMGSRGGGIPERPLLCKQSLYSRLRSLHIT